MLFLHVSSNCNQFLAILEKTNFVSILSAHIGSVRPYVGGWNDNDIHFFQITQNWIVLEFTCMNNIFYTIAQLIESRIRSF